MSKFRTKARTIELLGRKQIREDARKIPYEDIYPILYLKHLCLPLKCFGNLLSNIKSVCFVNEFTSATQTIVIAIIR